MKIVKLKGYAHNSFLLKVNFLLENKQNMDRKYYLRVNINFIYFKMADSTYLN